MPEYKKIAVVNLISLLEKAKECGLINLALQTELSLNMRMVLFNNFMNLKLDTLINALKCAQNIGEEEIVINTNVTYSANAIIIRGTKNQSLIYRKLT